MVSLEDFLLKNRIPEIEVHNWILGGLITQKVNFLDFEVPPTDKLICALVLLANLKKTHEVKGACRVEATSIATVLKE